MGHSHGMKWNEEMIKEMILKVVEVYGRMPSNNELKKYYNSTALGNKISKTGGFYHWAEKLGLVVKESETSKGIKYEGVVAEILENLGFDVEKTSTKAPYDLIVDGIVRIDVKVATKYLTDEYEVNSFGINKKYPSSDIYICVALDENSEIERIIVLPSVNVKRSSTISIGKKSKYNRYINNYGLINKFKKFYLEF